MAVATLGSIPLFFVLLLRNALPLFRTFVSYPKRVKNAFTDPNHEDVHLGLELAAQCGRSATYDDGPRATVAL